MWIFFNFDVYFQAIFKNVFLCPGCFILQQQFRLLYCITKLWAKGRHGIYPPPLSWMHASVQEESSCIHETAEEGLSLLIYHSQNTVTSIPQKLKILLMWDGILFSHVKVLCCRWNHFVAELYVCLGWNKAEEHADCWKNTWSVTAFVLLDFGRTGEAGRNFRMSFWSCMVKSGQRCCSPESTACTL